ncbi:MAG TPA: DUF1553 domain-containing protein [Gemmataceae bacterium]|nr:DUF1553 domain-containing protein [Gemmataceae bacterium]
MNRLQSLVLSLGILSLALTPALRAADKDVKALAAKIDERIAAVWGPKFKPAPLADDAEFFRRVHLDLAGRIPSVTEIRDFLDDEQPDKRRVWVDRILQADPDDASYKEAYINHFANVWRAWLLAQTGQQAQVQQPALETWLRQRIKAKIGYDRLVRELLTQPGNQGVGPGQGSAAVFYQANENKPENLAGSTARLFLGVKLECAQCHDHPFDKWTRTQFWEYAGFFTDLTPQGKRGEIKLPGKALVIRARFLDGKEPKWNDPTRTRPTLADWMTVADNPFFARAIVNRMWSHFFGVPLVHQAEGTTDDTPAAHKELLDELARQLVAHKYDLKFLIRAITASEAYQRSSAVTHPSQKDARLLARMPLRGLSPEQLFDSLAEATEYRDSASNPPGLFVGVQGARNRFLAKFAAQDQKTDYETSILQALYLMNNEFIADRTSLEKNRTLATLAEQRTSTARKVESLYLVVLSRKPRPEESERFGKYVEKGGPAGDPKKALADVFWVLLNSPEFILNH